MRLFYLIPARGGSKGIPHKNIKQLSGKPLIAYSIDVARQLTDDGHICVSTDDDEIMQVVTLTVWQYRLKDLMISRQTQPAHTRLFCMPSDMPVNLDTLADWMYLGAIMNKKR